MKDPDMEQEAADELPTRFFRLSGANVEEEGATILQTGMLAEEAKPAGGVKIDMLRLHLGQVAVGNATRRPRTAT